MQPLKHRRANSNLIIRSGEAGPKNILGLSKKSSRGGLQEYLSPSRQLALLGQASTLKENAVIFPAIPCNGFNNNLDNFQIAGEKCEEKQDRLQVMISDKVYDEIKNAEILKEHLKEFDEMNKLIAKSD